MNFDFSDELKALREQARKFLRERCPPATARRILEGAEPYDKRLWQEIAAMGWTGAAIPEAYGGAGLGHLGLCVLAEELGSALAPIPFSSSIYLAAEAIMLGGSEAQKKTWLPRLASGQGIGTLALAEGPGTAEPSKLRTTFRNGALAGDKLPVTDGDVADVAVVAAQSERGMLLVLVDLKASGVSRHRVDTIDPTRSYARIIFDGAAAEVIGEHGNGEALLRRIEQRAAVLFAFEQVGGAQRSLEMARDYALERYAFGRPIGSYQAIKHKLADVYVAIELARVECLLRRLGAQSRCRRTAAGGGVSTDSGKRSLFPGGQGEHPGARRHGLHLGVRLPPALSPSQAFGARARKHKAMERSPDHPLGSGQRPVVSGGGTWISKTHPRKPNSAPASAASWPRRPSHARPARGWFTAPATRIPSSARAPKPGRRRRQMPAMPASLGPRPGADAAAPPSSK